VLVLEVIVSPFTVRCSPFAVHRSLFTVRCSPFAVHRSLFTVRYSPFAVPGSPFIVFVVVLETLGFCAEKED
jgi:hypothetical protein